MRVLLALTLVAALGSTQVQPAGRLKITIVEGDGAINNIRQRTAREPIVQVEDENNRPVAGAVVVFLLPDRGASGVFLDGSRSMTVTTGPDGRAVARGMKPNGVEGKLEIRVNASAAGAAPASATITQMNQTIAAAGAAGGGMAAKWIAVIAIAGGAAAGGVFAATRGGGSTPATPAAAPRTILTPGTTTVGPPR